MLGYYVTPLNSQLNEGRALLLYFEIPAHALHIVSPQKKKYVE